MAAHSFLTKRENNEMSVLETTTTTPPTPAEKRAARLRESMPQTAKVLVAYWEENFDTLWGSPDVAATLVELGADAAEMFDLSSKYLTFLAGFMGGTPLQPELDRLLAKVAALPAYTIQPDGTVTLDPEV